VRIDENDGIDCHVVAIRRSYIVLIGPGESQANKINPDDFEVHFMSAPIHAPSFSGGCTGTRKGTGTIREGQNVTCTITI